MSPIIYTPHECKTPAPEDAASPHPVGTLWQCEVCETIWEAVRPLLGEWEEIADPRRKHCIEDASRRVPAEPTPTVTPGMVARAIDTYEDHVSVLPTDGSGSNGIVGHCEGCGVPVGPYTSKTHALEVAAAAVQAKINGGQDA